MKGLDEFDEAMQKKHHRMLEAADEAVNFGVMLLVAATQNQFQGSHRQGAAHVGGAAPNIVSGDLRRSIVGDPVTHPRPGVAQSTVAPHMKYGRRVELGFTGVDAAGRTFVQPPHPFFQPGVDAMTEKFGAAVARIFAKHM